MKKTAALTLTFAMLISGCSFFNSRDPEYKAAEEKKAAANKTPEEKAAAEKEKKEKDEKEKKEKEEAANMSSFSYDLNDTENREVNKYYESQNKAKSRTKKSVFGFGL